MEARKDFELLLQNLILNLYDKGITVHSRINSFTHELI